ncbi:MAG: Ku protein [Crenarchaeota archaeon]|nr:Ku protein [Thermoproteota archaeon]
MGMSYKGAISFGLIYIPVTLHTVIRSNEISFNLIDKNTMSRVQYKKTCINCQGKEIKQGDIIKGYEYEEGKYVLFTPEDFEKIKSKKDKNITISQFISLNGIDPIYYDKAYYIVPAKGAERAFMLLKTAMEKEKKIGIAKTVLGTKETLIAIRVKDRIMYLNTLHFHEELQVYPYQDVNMKLEKQELNLAVTLLNTMTKPFDITEYTDEYRRKIEQAIQAKMVGQEVHIKEEGDLHPALDLMTALQESLHNLEDARA